MARTGHCHLNQYLHRFDIIETPECECELYDEERDELRRRVGIEGMRSSVLLGDNKVIKKTVEYIEKTGRFKLEQR